MNEQLGLPGIGNVMHEVDDMLASYATRAAMGARPRSDDRPPSEAAVDQGHASPERVALCGPDLARAALEQALKVTGIVKR